MGGPGSGRHPDASKGNVDKIITHFANQRKKSETRRIQKRIKKSRKWNKESGRFDW